MTNYKLTIQYDGGRYKGWQRLGQADYSIQGKIENVLSEMVGSKIEIIGCSRTDAGVHALAQVANVKLDGNYIESDIMKYLHRYLPNDISVVKVEIVHDRFHARYNAKDKTYVYKIWNESYINPFMRKYSMHVEEKLDITKMRKAANHFLGEHDFTSFSNAKSKKKSMVRTISLLQIEEKDRFITIRVKGNGFLHNMVRKIVGTLVKVGLGEVDENRIPHIIQSKERNQADRIAPPTGLYLEKINY